MTHSMPSDTQTADRMVIGVGNIHRRDDGVGVVIAKKIKDLDDHNFVVLEASGEGATLMHMWENADSVILIDAVRSGSSPGSIHRLDVQKERLLSDFFHYSTHAFSVAEAVEMSRALGSLPDKMIVYGIEGQDFSAGIGLSQEVEASAEQVIREITTQFVAVAT